MNWRKSMTADDELKADLAHVVDTISTESVAERLKRLAPEEYKTPSIPVTSRPITTRPLHAFRRTLSVGSSDTVCNVKLNDEWTSDDWDRVAAFAFLKMFSWQYAEMMEGMFRLGKEDNGEDPSKPFTEEDHAMMRQWERTFHKWAKKKLNK